jgi:hypothetical protein
VTLMVQEPWRTPLAIPEINNRLRRTFGASQSILLTRSTISNQFLVLLSCPQESVTGRGAFAFGGIPTKPLVWPFLCPFGSFDLARLIRVRENFDEGNGWANAYDFHRMHALLPDALKGQLCQEGGSVVCFVRSAVSKSSDDTSDR